MNSKITKFIAINLIISFFVVQCEIFGRSHSQKKIEIEKIVEKVLKKQKKEKENLKQKNSLTKILPKNSLIKVLLKIGLIFISSMTIVLCLKHFDKILDILRKSSSLRISNSWSNQRYYCCPYPNSQSSVSFSINF
ncbi:MAG: hypothetical protein LBJ32_03435 [Oscillospiraceae bacterium]|jgi:hypothetical protein|nr:hypothetical protein [Oscillospiraceae bacterium]